MMTEPAGPHSSSHPHSRSGMLRHLAPVLVGLGLFGVGLWALHRLLKPVDPADVLAQMQSTPLHVLLIALGATAMGYLALIGYDFWALKYLDKKLPVRVVALGGFLGYAFGNTIGVSVLSGGAVRYRIYSAFGLNAFEVAALASYIAIAMGTGLSLVGILALALHPAALAGLLPLSEGAVRALALLGGGGTLALLYALAFSGKSLHWRRYELSMPNPKILTGQMVVALFDSTMASLTLYILMPAGTPDFVTFLAIYAAATMVGVMSHVPGGVGVFETVVMAAMPAGVNAGEVAAALLMFRIIYYLLPFAIAFIIVSLNEARLAGGWAVRLFGEVSEPMRPAFSALSGVVPWLAGAWALGFGSYLLAVSLMPSVRAAAADDNDIVGAILLEGGTLTSAVTGIVLLILSQGLARRISGAFVLTLVALGGGAVAALLNGLRIDSALLLIGGALLLLPFRHEFYRRAAITEGVLSPVWFGLVLAVVLSAGTFFFFIHAATPWSQAMWWDFATSANTPRALRAGLLASAMLLVFTIVLALQPVRRRAAAPPTDPLEHAARIVVAQDRPQACLALTGDKEFRFSPDGRAFIMFARRRNHWIAFGDPVGPEDALNAAGWAFVEAAQNANGRPVFYEISQRHLPLMVEMGLSLHEVGEEAVVRLPGFSLAQCGLLGPAHAAALRAGLTVEVMQPPHAPALIEELRAISDAWLAAPVGLEKGFSAGRFDTAYLNHFPIAVVRRAGKAVAFANILSPGSGRRVALDLMRYLPEDAAGLSPVAMIEFLFVSLIERYRDAGAQEFSLGMAPLAGLSERRTDRLWSRFGSIMFRHGGAFEDFDSLRSFKQKFHPDWRPRYIALPVGVSPMMAMADVATLIAGGPHGLLRRPGGAKTPAKS
ncbi:bifunctional lysylphosphatidylglycerol flippase/synthetase MprF [Paenirhodobacter populi]|uniref:bifunctional lysylphosphatidylglycerol flippase/synthetase MprF n=1 Tax=Paenirhodobacter populi TaxID=2306993 RepID=UPI001F4F55AB|nr:bifunctional lysylphosphatidylglycerol flippase/synthetase MprF [Sinirhodobacter populi]